MMINRLGKKTLLYNVALQISQSVQKLYYVFRPSSTPIAIMSVTKDAECYNMNHKNRGKCVIFNHEIFDVGFEKRKGSATDAERLQRSFSTLDFDVEVHNDLSHVEVMNEIEKRAQLFHFMQFYKCFFNL